MEDSRALPGDVIATVAKAMAGRHKSFAALWFAIVGICLLALVSKYADSVQVNHSDHANDASALVGFLIVGGIPGVLGIRRLMGARLATRIAEQTTEPTLTWFLNDKLIVAADARGVARPELSLKITRTLASTLTAVPRATVVSSVGEHRG